MKESLTHRVAKVIFLKKMLKLMVPRRGLEPPHLTALDPKSSVSTNFTTWAFRNV